MIQDWECRLLISWACVAGTVGWVCVLDGAEEVVGAFRGCGCDADVERHCGVSKGWLVH